MTALLARLKRRAACPCGHDKPWHEHYRPGTDCSHPTCGCGRYRGKR